MPTRTASRSIGLPSLANCIFICLSLVSCTTVHELGASIKKTAQGQSLESAFDSDKLTVAFSKDRKIISTSLKQLHAEFNAKLAHFSTQIQDRWGEKDVKVASSTKYVKYTDSYKSRATVDFDNGQITVETLDGKSSTNRLKQAIITTVLTSHDPQAVDLFSDKSISLDKKAKPYLQELIRDHQGMPIQNAKQAEKFAEFLLKKKARTRTSISRKEKRVVRFVQIAMVKNFESKKIEPYRSFITSSSQKYDISPSLIYAIIKTESNFNPYAVSSAPAYGLMQLVPTSGGREAYRHAKGTDKVPSPNYLFNPKNNIELGTAYLNVLTYKELKDISDSTTRDYCVIAAYNTGPGNLFRTFSKDRRVAIKEINRLSPAALYDKLRRSLPYQETRNYLKKVVKNRKTYQVSPRTSL